MNKKFVFAGAIVAFVAFVAGFVVGILNYDSLDSDFDGYFEDWDDYETGDFDDEYCEGESGD